MAVSECSTRWSQCLVSSLSRSALKSCTTCMLLRLFAFSLTLSEMHDHLGQLGIVPYCRKWDFMCFNASDSHGCSHYVFKSCGHLFLENALISASWSQYLTNAAGNLLRFSTNIHFFWPLLINLYKIMRGRHLNITFMIISCKECPPIVNHWAVFIGLHSWCSTGRSDADTQWAVPSQTCDIYKRHL